MSKKLRAMIRVCASLGKDPWPYDLHALGEIFSTGCGVRRNYELALFWEKKALRHGSAAAQHAVRRLKALLDPGHIHKSAKIRERLESKIAEISRNFLVGKIKVKVASNQISAVQEDVECDMYDGKMTPKDGNAVLRACERAFDVSDMRWRVATKTFRKKGE